MKFNLKKIGTVSLAAVSLLPSYVFAQGLVQSPSDNPPIKNVDDIIRVINTIVNYMFTGLILLATIMTLYAAYLYLTAGGNEENVGKAKNAIIYAAVGVAVALLSKAVVFIVKSILGVA